MWLHVIFIVNLVVQVFSENAFSSSGGSSSAQDVIVETSLGKIRGTTLQSSLGNRFYAFRGIRYAKSPVDDLRFQPPEPIEAWNGTFDATLDGPRCPQPGNLSDISEDCLRINVYTRALPCAKSLLKPVIVYLHSGGFYVQSAQSYNFAGPQYFMDRDVVLVTLEYRLGLLGFLSTGTADAPGNNGLKDQVVALKWITQHISQFGGDPKSITLLGYSAGSRSIVYHLISPMSRGLFHKVIVMSGSGVSQIEIPTEQLYLAQRQARLLNCTTDGIQEMIACLKTKDAVDYATTLRYMFDFAEGLPVLLFRPVVEPDFGQERFLTDDPTVLYQKGEFMRIPIITGINTDEFASSAIKILNNDTLRNQLNQDFEKLAPICFMYEGDTERINQITATLKREYLNDEPLDPARSQNGLSHLFADAVTGFANYQFVHLAATGTLVYHYRFSFQGRYSHFYWPPAKPYGIVHHDDLLYIFSIPRVAPIFTKDDPERIALERLIRMWTTFAATGNPNNQDDEYLKDINWEPFTLDNEQYLDIGENMTMKQRLYKDRFSIWERFYPWKSTMQ